MYVYMYVYICKTMASSPPPGKWRESNFEIRGDLHFHWFHWGKKQVGTLYDFKADGGKMQIFS